MRRASWATKTVPLPEKGIRKVTGKVKNRLELPNMFGCFQPNKGRVLLIEEGLEVSS